MKSTVLPISLGSLMLAVACSGDDNGPNGGASGGSLSVGNGGAGGVLATEGSGGSIAPSIGGSLAAGGMQANEGGAQSVGGTLAAGGSSGSITGGAAQGTNSTAAGGKAVGGSVASGGSTRAGTGAGGSATGGKATGGGSTATGGTATAGASGTSTPGCSVTFPGATGNEPGGLIPVCCTPTASEKAYIDEVFTLLNAHRAANNLSAYAYDSGLEQAIQGHCVHMSQHTFFEHTAPESTVASPSARIAACMPGANLRGWAENIAQGQRNPTSVMTAWTNSSGHNANMLSSTLTRVGIGYVTGGNYWGQVFAR